MAISFNEEFEKFWQFTSSASRLPTTSKRNVIVEKLRSSKKSPPAILRQSVKLEKWTICISPNRPGFVYVEGYLKDSEPPQLWHSSSIVQRLTTIKLRSNSNQIYELVGSLCRKSTLNQGWPPSIAQAFQNGFPVDWETQIQDSSMAFANVENRVLRDRTRPSGRSPSDSIISKRNTSIFESFGCSPPFDVASLSQTRSGRIVIPRVGRWVNNRLVPAYTGELVIPDVKKHSPFSTTLRTTATTCIHHHEKYSGNICMRHPVEPARGNKIKEPVKEKRESHVLQPRNSLSSNDKEDNVPKSILPFPKASKGDKVQECLNASKRNLDSNETESRCASKLKSNHVDQPDVDDRNAPKQIVKDTSNISKDAKENNRRVLRSRPKVHQDKIGLPTKTKLKPTTLLEHQERDIPIKAVCDNTLGKKANDIKENVCEPPERSVKSVKGKECPLKRVTAHPGTVRYRKQIREYLTEACRRDDDDDDFMNTTPFRNTNHSVNVRDLLAKGADDVLGDDEVANSQTPKTFVAAVEPYAFQKTPDMSIGVSPGFLSVMKMKNIDSYLHHLARGQKRKKSKLFSPESLQRPAKIQKVTHIRARNDNLSTLQKALRRPVLHHGEEEEDADYYFSD